MLPNESKIKDFELAEDHEDHPEIFNDKLFHEDIDFIIGASLEDNGVELMQEIQTLFCDVL